MFLSMFEHLESLPRTKGYSAVYGPHVSTGRHDSRCNQRVPFHLHSNIYNPAENYSRSPLQSKQHKPKRSLGSLTVYKPVRIVVLAL
jgi:hypothetical protein